MTNSNVSTPFLDIQRSKLQETIVANSRCGNTCKFMVFATIVGRTCSTRDEWEGKITWGHCAILTNIAKYFHMKIVACNLCKHNAQGLQETFVLFHHHFCKGLLSQNMQWLYTLLAHPFSSFIVYYYLFDLKVWP